MDEYQSLSHSQWECKYHVIFIPKFRRKVPCQGGINPRFVWNYRSRSTSAEFQTLGLVPTEPEH